MKYIVILHSGSPIGEIYSKGNNDGLAGDSGHPILECSEISMDNHQMLFVKRVLKSKSSHQSVHIPYSSVVAIYQFAEEMPTQLGFKVS